MISGNGKEIREIVILENGSLARLMGTWSIYELKDIVKSLVQRMLKAQRRQLEIHKKRCVHSFK